MSFDPELLQRYLFQLEMPSFDAYLETISRFLKDETKKLKEEIKSKKRVLDDEPGEPTYEDYLSGLLNDIDEFENIWLNSFFVTIYGFLESQLMKRCREFEQKNKNPKPSLQDWRNENRRLSITEQAIKYLIEVQKVDFSLKKHSIEWKKIDNYGPLRNCIVHNESRVDEGLNKTQRNKLNEFIRWKDSKLQFYNPYVVLNKNFAKTLSQQFGISCGQYYL